MFLNGCMNRTSNMPISVLRYSLSCVEKILAKQGTDLKFETEANLKALFPKSKRSSILLTLITSNFTS